MKTELYRVESAIKGTIPHYKVAAKVLANGGIYKRQAPYNGYGDLLGGMCALYVWENDTVECIAHNVTSHRANQIIRHYQDYKSGRIPTYVWDNYCTNGYNTRRGLLANYTKKEERIRKIAKSHANYMGCETFDSTLDHDRRVMMRSS